MSRGDYLKAEEDKMIGEVIVWLGKMILLQILIVGGVLLLFYLMGLRA